jgi:hypothetical protein
MAHHALLAYRTAMDALTISVPPASVLHHTTLHFRIYRFEMQLTLACSPLSHHYHLVIVTCTI